jgi:hypothetical protein
MSRPNIDPITGSVIKIGGPEYRKLVDKYGEPNKIKSPKSNKLISVNKGEYKKLIKSGYTDNRLLYKIDIINNANNKNVHDIINDNIINDVIVIDDDIKHEIKKGEEIDYIFQQLINNGNMNDLHLLSRTNKELRERLSLPENLKTLMYITNLTKYYTLDDVYDFDELYFLYVSLNDRKKIYKYIKSTFTLEDFERAQELGRKELVENVNYEEFFKHQWDTIMAIENRKELNFVKFLCDVGGGFGFIDKQYMLPQFNNGIVYDLNRNLCLTMNR